MSSESQKTYYSQHPVPQHVLGVEFKLVGGLTIKQFGYAGGSIVLAYLTYASILPPIFKIPLAIFIAILGLSIAFLPVNERSMDEYLKNFLIAITSPTERVWIKQPATIDIFFEDFALAPHPTEINAEIAVQGRKNIRDYIGKMKFEGSRSTLDLKEEEYLKSLASEFGANLKTSGAAAAGAERIPTSVAPTYSPERVEVRATSTLASEVNFSNQNIISIPLGGKSRKFMTSIKNIKAGRKLHNLPTIEGEIVMPVSGEIVLKESRETLPPQEELLRTAENVVANLETLTPSSPKVDPALTAPSRTEPQPTIEPKKQTQPEPQSQVEQISHPTETSNPPKWFPDGEKAKAVAKVAVFNEEMEKLKKQNEELFLQLNREKKLREDAERIAEESRRFREKIHYLEEQNEKMNKEIKQSEEGYRKILSEATSSKTEKENAARILKEQQRRLEALSREKAESVDEIVRLQKELQTLRGRSQRTTVEGLTTSAQERTSPPGQDLPANPPPYKPHVKPMAFIKDLPNVINGYVKGKNGNLIKNAVIIVKDQSDDVVRALKTNELGQFAITTPLPNGLYHVEASSDGSTFDIITVDLSGTVLEPVEFDGR